MPSLKLLVVLNGMAWYCIIAHSLLLAGMTGTGTSEREVSKKMTAPFYK